jgi:hypothetical protein
MSIQIIVGWNAYEKCNATKENCMAQDKHYLDEPDIGSGEKTAGQKEVERDAQAVRPTQGNEFSDKNQSSSPEGRLLREGDHIARILVVKQPDETYEAQVYVRLTREPELAETYIPSGIFATEAEAWSAAEERAKRAFEEHEF